MSPLYRRTVTAPVPTAKAVVHRMPVPAQQVGAARLGRGVRTRRARAERSSVANEAPKPRPTPKGPAFRLWRPAYQRLVAGAWRGTPRGWS